MRRPTKELVDAVPGAADERGRAGSVRAVSEGAGSSEPRTGGQGGEKAVRTVVIKKEGEGEGEEVGGWRDDTGMEPGSPLERKSEASAGPMGPLPASVLTERRRRVSGLVRDEVGEQGDGVKARDGAASAVKALVAGMGRKERDGRNRDRERAGHEEDREKEREKERSGGGHEDGGDVYDFHGSESETESRATSKARAEMKASARARDKDGFGGKGGGSGSGSLPQTDKIRVSRRVSSVVEGLGKADGADEVGENGRAGGNAGRMGEMLNSTTGSLRSRKRRDTLASVGAGGDGDVEGKDEGGARMGTRAERAVGRRRSMMV